MTAHNLSSSKYYVKSKFDMNHAKFYIIMCLKNVFGRVRVSEANEHPNVNIHFSSSKSYREGEFDMNRAKYYTNMSRLNVFIRMFLRGGPLRGPCEAPRIYISDKVHWFCYF